MRLANIFFEHRRYSRSSLVFDRIARTRRYRSVGITVITGRQISHVGQIGLEQIVDSFGERFTTREFLLRPVCVDVGILSLQRSLYSFNRHSAVSRQRSNTAI
jgi:hypothetical protein